MPRERTQGSRDWAAGAAVQAAVFGGATLSHQRRTQRPFRHRICDQDAPSKRLGRSSSAGESLDGLAGLAARGRAGRGCRRSLRSRRMGVISPPRFFSPLFSSRGQGCPRRAGGCGRHSKRRADGKSISMIPVSLSSCYAGRGGKTKTEGLQYFEPKGNVLLGSPGELLTLRRQHHEHP